MLAIVTSHPIQYQAPLWRALTAAGVPLRVWFLTNHGVEKLHDAGFGQSFAWDVDLLSGYSSEFLDIEPGWDLNRFRGVRLRERLAMRLRQDQVRALWIEGWRLQANWQALRAARSAGVQVWLRGESNDLKPDHPLKSLVKRPLLRRFFDRVDQFLCIGSANRRLYESYGVAESKLHRAPYFVDNDWFQSASRARLSQRDEIRKQWAIPHDSFCVLFCGKFIAKKRPLDLVQAIRKINATAKETSPIHILFVGSGEMRAVLRDACVVVHDVEGTPSAETTPGDRPTASFAGFLNQSEIARAYVAADLLVLPSDCGETWGLVANEAMACGLPAAVSDQCGCAEDLVATLDPKLVFRCGDVDSLAAAVGHARSTRIDADVVCRAADSHHLRTTVETVVRLYDRVGDK